MIIKEAMEHHSPELLAVLGLSTKIIHWLIEMEPIAKMITTYVGLALIITGFVIKTIQLYKEWNGKNK